MLKTKLIALSLGLAACGALGACGQSAGEAMAGESGAKAASASCSGWLPDDFPLPPGTSLTTCKEVAPTRTLEGTASKTADADTLTADLISQLKAAGFAASDSSGTVMPGYKLISFDRTGTHGQMQLSPKDGQLAVWIALRTDLD